MKGERLARVGLHSRELMEEEVPVQDPYWKKVILDTGRAVLTSAAKVLDFINAGREDF